jgi:hypothetical protein
LRRPRVAVAPVPPDKVMAAGAALQTPGSDPVFGGRIDTPSKVIARAIQSGLDVQQFNDSTVARYSIGGASWTSVDPAGNLARTAGVVAPFLSPLVAAGIRTFNRVTVTPERVSASGAAWTDTYVKQAAQAAKNGQWSVAIARLQDLQEARALLSPSEQTSLRVYATEQDLQTLQNLAGVEGNDLAPYSSFLMQLRPPPTKNNPRIPVAGAPAAPIVPGVAPEGANPMVPTAPRG